MALARWASELARTLLAEQLPQRWAHTQGVARQARTLTPILGDDADLLEAAAWLHDIGYNPTLVVTGFHPLDGARYLRDIHHANPRLSNLVAHHSCAIIEAEERKQSEQLMAEFKHKDDPLTPALIYCDMTTDPAGHRTFVDARLDEILERYGDDHIVCRFIHRAAPELTAAALAILGQLSQTTLGHSEARHTQERHARQ